MQVGAHPGDVDVATVRGFVRGDERVREVGVARTGEGVEVVVHPGGDDRGREHPHAGCEQRCVDHRGLPGALTTIERADDAGCENHPAGEVAQRRPGQWDELVSRH